MSEISMYDDEELNEYGRLLRIKELRTLLEAVTRERDEARARSIWHTFECVSLVEHEKVVASVARLREALEGIAEEFESTVRHIDSKGRGGQHVPFHGDFASACQLPSFCSRAKWWATHLRAALKETEP